MLQWNPGNPLTDVWYRLRGQWLRAERQRRHQPDWDIGDSAFARLIGILPYDVYVIKSGNHVRRPTLAKCAKIAAFFGVPLALIADAAQREIPAPTQSLTQLLREAAPMIPDEWEDAPAVRAALAVAQSPVFIVSVFGENAANYAQVTGISTPTLLRLIADEAAAWQEWCAQHPQS